MLKASLTCLQAPPSRTQHHGDLGVDPRGDLSHTDGGSATKPADCATFCSSRAPARSPETSVWGSLLDFQGRPARCCQVSVQEEYFLLPSHQQSLCRYLLCTGCVQTLYTLSTHQTFLRWMLIVPLLHVGKESSRKLRKHT